MGFCSLLFLFFKNIFTIVVFFMPCFPDLQANQKEAGPRAGPANGWFVPRRQRNITTEPRSAVALRRWPLSSSQRRARQRDSSYPAPSETFPQDPNQPSPSAAGPPSSSQHQTRQRDSSSDFAPPKRKVRKDPFYRFCR